MNKYEISYEIYERYEGGATSTARFSAEDDFEALKKVAEHLSLYVNDDEFFDSREEALEEGYDEDELEDLYIKGETDVDEIVTAMTDCDGQDYIYYIKRPDGSYLYDSGECSVEDWDD